MSLAWFGLSILGAAAAYGLGRTHGQARGARAMWSSLLETPGGWMIGVARRLSVDEHRAVVELLRQDLDWRQTTDPAIPEACQTTDA